MSYNSQIHQGFMDHQVGICTWIGLLGFFAWSVDKEWSFSDYCIRWFKTNLERHCWGRRTNSTKHYDTREEEGKVNPGKFSGQFVQQQRWSCRSKSQTAPWSWTSNSEIPGRWWLEITKQWRKLKLPTCLVEEKPLPIFLHLDNCRKSIAYSCNICPNRESIQWCGKHN